MPGRFGKPDRTGRSSGLLHGRAGRLQRPPEGEPFVWLTRELIESDAWQKRSRQCIRLLDFLMLDHMAHAGTENGRLMATYDQLVHFGFSRRKIGAAISEAECLGLIHVERGGRNQPSTFRLTWLADRDGHGPTNDWKQYREKKIRNQVPKVEPNKCHQGEPTAPPLVPHGGTSA